MEVENPVSVSNNLITMKNMVDLALGTPEVGAVNFNVLHTLLHAMLENMQMGQVTIESKDKDGKSGTASDNNIIISTTPYHQLQDRLKIIESQISDLNSLPRNNDILAGFISSKPDEAKRTVSDLWQVMNLKKKVGSNEEGIDKLSSLIDQILGDLRQVKEDNQKLKQSLEDLSNLKGINDKLKGLENDLTNLRAEFNDLRDKFSLYPSPDAFKNVVTWEGLENALRGVQDDMDKLKKTEKVFVNMATEPMSRPPSSASAGPSEACAEMLEKLGNLADEHIALEKRVKKLEDEMPNKADKKDLENLKIPDDLLKLINQLKSQVEQLMASKNRDSEALARIREILNGLQDRVKDLNLTVDKVEAENKDIVKQIQELFSITTDHENRKADISYVDSLIRTKADKSLVDSKVGFTLFDETTSNLHNLIDDIMKKLMATEEELRNLLKNLSNELDNKVDKEDLAALREWIEKRLRALAEKLKNLRGLDITDDEAAGLRKQLLQHFHCISCDRPVDMLPQNYNPSDKLPDPKGLPPNKSLRPYTTYELDAIRQQAKSYGADIIDVYQTPRPCGGSHTTTYSHKRMMRLNNNNSYVEDDPNSGFKLTKEELDLQGTDGHIYRGRLERNQTTMGNYAGGTNFNASIIANSGDYSNNYNGDKLPPVALPQSRSSTVIPKSGFVTRPKSAVKISPRPSTGGNQSNSRPMSAKQITKKELESRGSSPNKEPTEPMENNVSTPQRDIDSIPSISRQDPEPPMSNKDNEQIIITDNDLDIEIVDSSLTTNTAPENSSQNPISNDDHTET